MLTVLPTYHSALNKMRTEVKIEVDFCDADIHPYENKTLGTYIGDADLQELAALHEERFRTYSTPVERSCYDCREMFIEKCRAMMTRRVYKPRDSLDLYHLSRTKGLDVPDYKGGDHKEGPVRT